jgi:hypothetical protein
MGNTEPFRVGSRRPTTFGEKRIGGTPARTAGLCFTIVSVSLTCVNPLTKLDLGQLARLFFVKHGRFLGSFGARSDHVLPRLGRAASVAIPGFAIELMSLRASVNIIDVRTPGHCARGVGTRPR